MYDFTEYYWHDFFLAKSLPSAACYMSYNKCVNRKCCLYEVSAPLGFYYHTSHTLNKDITWPSKNVLYYYYIYRQFFFFSPSVHGLWSQMLQCQWSRTKLNLMVCQLHWQLCDIHHCGWSYHLRLNQSSESNLCGMHINVSLPMMFLCLPQILCLLFNNI